MMPPSMMEREKVASASISRSGLNSPLCTPSEMIFFLNSSVPIRACWAFSRKPG